MDRERKNLESIRVSSFEALYPLLFDVVNDGILIVDKTGKIRDCNIIFHQRLGYDKDDILGMNVRDIDSPEFASRVPERIQKIIDYGQLTFETAHYRKDGTVMPVELNTRSIFVDEEMFFLSIVRDITEHQEAKARLENARNDLEALFEYAPEGIFIADLNGRYTDVNHAGCEMLGYEKEELLGKSIIDLIRKEDIHRLDKEKDAMLAGEFVTGEWLLRHKNGTMVPTEVNARILHDGRWQGFVRDITDRKALSRKLYEKERMYRALVESSGNGFWACDMQGRIFEVNEAYVQLSGYSREELMGMSIPDLEAMEQPEETRRHIEKVVHDGFDLFETHHRRKDGKIWPVEIAATYWPHKGGIILVFNTDISERKKAEEELRVLSQALTQAGEGIVITDPKGIIEYVNPAFERISGYSDSEAIGKPVSILKSNAQNSELYKHLWQTISQGKQWEGTLIDRAKDGSFYPALVSIAPVYEGDEIAHYVSIHKDMTEYQRLEEQLVQAQKQESLGTLVGGIAHDFNNMLAALQGNLYLAMVDKDDHGALQERLENINSISEKAALVVRQLLTFAKKDLVEMEEVSLNHLISEGFKLAKTTIPENITHHLDFCDRELIVTADVTQLQQAFINLSNNARDAVAEVEHPVIEWALSEFEPDDEFRNKHPQAVQKHYAKITVRDNGHGIREEHMKAVFDPFFTTKGAKGTGLGLAMVFGSAERHNGIIEIESKEGEGCAFHIYLPLSEGSARVESHKAKIAPSLTQHHETILLVDDDAQLQQVARDVLGKLGYTVLTALNGEEALAIYRDYHADISLVLTDVIMPGIGGAELARRLRAEGSETPIILVTGYDREQALRGIFNIRNTHLLSKPYSFDELNRLIKEMINHDS